MNSQETVAKFFNRLRDEGVEQFERATVGIYGFQDNKIAKDRTGVLFRIADAVFIITASHGLRQIVEARIPLFVSWNGRTDIPVQLLDSRYVTTKSEPEYRHDADVPDVAVIRLSDSSAREIIGSDQVPLGLQDICVTEDRSKAIYMMVGLPNCWVRADETGLRCTPLRYICGMRTEEHWDGTEMGYNPDLHLLLDFNRDAVAPINGTSHTLPGYEGLVGVSGCGIWRILRHDVSLDEWDGSQCKLVAIQHRYYEKPSYLHTTWIRHAVGLIFQEYPELKGATSIVYPHRANAIVPITK